MTSHRLPSSPQINASVMASAGTGKTYLLVNRLVRLLLSGARPDAILAITFTRKAAAEMQTRLAERLLTLASSEDNELAERLRELHEPHDPATMARARRLYENLLQSRHTIRTTTFHAFCQDILLRFPLEADVPPGFELLESTGELLRAARDAVMAEASARPDGELAMALHQLLEYCGGLDGLERALSSFIQHRGDWWAYCEQTDQAIPHAKAELLRLLQINPEQDPLEQFFTAERVDMLAEFSELLGKHSTKGNDEARTALAIARDQNQTITERFEACRQAFLTQKSTPRSRKANKTQAKSMGAEGEARFLEIHQIISHDLLEAIEQQMAIACWHANAAWYLAGTTLLQHFQQLKQEQRLLDFTDLEWRAYRLLNNADNALWVQYKLDQRIDHLLVDEFQDTNPTQWRLLLPLLQEMAAGDPERQRSVFLVGDAKQSIYRFRRAEPRLLQTAHEWMETHLGAEAFPLHISWRSSPAIMHFANQVFGEHGPLQGQLRNYTHHDTHHHGLWGQITILPLQEGTTSAEEEDTETESSSLRNPLQQPRIIAPEDGYLREGRQIATCIRELVESGKSVGLGDSARRISYGDIMILVRKRTHVGYYEQALRDADIPYIGAERGTLLQSLEVSDMVALLEVLITPYNNLSLAAVLRSPLFNCSDENLVRLAEHDKGGWYQRLQTLAPSLGTEHPLAVAAIQLEQWRQLAGKVPIHDLLDRIFCEGNVLERYQAAFPAHLGSRARANLIRFLELALEIDSGRYPSIGHFLARLETMRDNSDEAPDEAPASANADRVRILTIHASKGLESPVVFLADSAQGKSNDKPYRVLLQWPPESPRPNFFLLMGKKDQQPEFIRRELEAEQQEQARESANLLYVALTRARQLLYISGVRPKKGEDIGWYGQLRNALDPTEEYPSDSPVTHESGTPTTSKRVSPPQQENIATSVNQQLRHPIKLKPADIEIAPSYQQTTPHGTPQGGDEDGRLRGIVIHRLLQEMSSQKTAQWQLCLERVASEFGINPAATDTQAWYRESCELMQDNALARIFTLQHGGEALNEVPILYRQENGTVHGIIDRLIVTPEEAWVIDYKTHRYADRQNCDELASHYQKQIGYYTEGIRKLWPERNIRGFVLFTAPRLLHEIVL